MHWAKKLSASDNSPKHRLNNGSELPCNSRSAMPCSALHCARAAFFPACFSGGILACWHFQREGTNKECLLCEDNLLPAASVFRLLKGLVCCTPPWIVGSDCSDHSKTEKFGHLQDSFQSLAVSWGLVSLPEVIQDLLVKLGHEWGNLQFTSLWTGESSEPSVCLMEKRENFVSIHFLHKIHHFTYLCQVSP